MVGENTVCCRYIYIYTRAHRQTDRQIDRQTETKRDSETDKQTDRESATKTKGQVDRRIYKTDRDNEKPAEDQRQKTQRETGGGNSNTLFYKDWRERERERAVSYTHLTLPTMAVV